MGLPDRATLPAAQRATLEAVERLIAAASGVSPSFREIARARGVKSLQGVSELLRKLRAKGFVTFDDRRPRSLRVLDRSVRLPAGYALTCEETEAWSSWGWLRIDGDRVVESARGYSSAERATVAAVEHARARGGGA